MAVQDDGAGLAIQTREDGLGLRLIRAFARKVGATLAISGGWEHYSLDAACDRRRRVGQHTDIRNNDGPPSGVMPQRARARQ